MKCYKSRDHFSCWVTDYWANSIPSSSITGGHPRPTGGFVCWVGIVLPLSRGAIDVFDRPSQRSFEILSIKPQINRAIFIIDSTGDLLWWILILESKATKLCFSFQRYLDKKWHFRYYFNISLSLNHIDSTVSFDSLSHTLSLSLAICTYWPTHLVNPIESTQFPHGAYECKSLLVG